MLLPQSLSLFGSITGKNTSAFRIFLDLLAELFTYMLLQDGLSILIPEVIDRNKFLVSYTRSVVLSIRSI